MLVKIFVNKFGDDNSNMMTKIVSFYQKLSKKSSQSKKKLLKTKQNYDFMPICTFFSQKKSILKKLAQQLQ